MDESEELVAVYRSPNETQAHVVRIALENAGIRAVVAGEHDPYKGCLGWSAGPHVLVQRKDQSAAVAVIGKMREAEAGDSDP